MVKYKGSRLPYCDPKGQQTPNQFYYELKGDVKQADRINEVLYGIGSHRGQNDRLRK